MERFPILVNGWKLLTIFAKRSNLDFWQGSEYAYEFYLLDFNFDHNDCDTEQYSLLRAVKFRWYQKTSQHKKQMICLNINTAELGTCGTSTWLQT